MGISFPTKVCQNIIEKFSDEEIYKKEIYLTSKYFNKLFKLFVLKSYNFENIKRGKVFFAEFCVKNKNILIKRVKISITRENLLELSKSNCYFLIRKFLYPFVEKYKEKTEFFSKTINKCFNNLFLTKNLQSISDFCILFYKTLNLADYVYCFDLDITVELSSFNEKIFFVNNDDDFCFNFINIVWRFFPINPRKFLEKLIKNNKRKLFEQVFETFGIFNIKNLKEDLLDLALIYERIEIYNFICLKNSKKRKNLEF